MNAWETHAPVVSASTAQLVLIMSVVFGMTTWCADFTDAFVHADLPKEDHFIELPKGCANKDRSDCALPLKRALCGSCGSPKRFFMVLKDSCIQGAESRHLHQDHGWPHFQEDPPPLARLASARRQTLETRAEAHCSRQLLRNLQFPLNPGHLQAMTHLGPDTLPVIPFAAFPSITHQGPTPASQLHHVPCLLLKMVA
jgi:hypothetical protein